MKRDYSIGIGTSQRGYGDEPACQNRPAPYSEEALRIESAAAVPDYPPPVDREAWAGAGIGWD